MENSLQMKRALRKRKGDFAVQVRNHNSKSVQVNTNNIYACIKSEERVRRSLISSTPSPQHVPTAEKLGHLHVVL